MKDIYAFDFHNNKLMMRNEAEQEERRYINNDESGRRGEISHYDDERWKKKRDISPTMRLK